jgi:hypothetical protein
MKFPVLLLASFFVAGPLLVPASAQTTSATAKANTAKQEEEPKIPGVTIPRGNGTFLGLEVVGGNFKLSFYDKKKKPMPVDVTRATARWPNTRSATVAFNRTVLNPAGANYLVGAKPVLPPFAWNVFIVLLQGEGDNAKAIETFSVPFHG